MQEYGGLCHLGLFQIFVSTLKHDVGNAITQNLVSLLKQFFCLLIVVVQVLAHTYKLCSLSGKNKCFHYLLDFNMSKNAAKVRISEQNTK